MGSAKRFFYQLIRVNELQWQMHKREKLSGKKAISEQREISEEQVLLRVKAKSGKQALPKKKVRAQRKPQVRKEVLTAKTVAENPVEPVQPSLPIRQLPVECAWRLNEIRDIAGSFHIEYSYEGGIYNWQGMHNPWIERAKLDMFFRSKGLNGFEENFPVQLHHEKWRSFLIYTGCPMDRDTQRISIWADELTSLISVCNMLEEYFINGYGVEPDVQEELIEKYTPVRCDIAIVYSGYHDEDDQMVTFFNAAGEKIDEIRARDGNGSEYSSLIHAVMPRGVIYKK